MNDWSLTDRELQSVNQNGQSQCYQNDGGPVLANFPENLREKENWRKSISEISSPGKEEGIAMEVTAYGPPQAVHG